MKSCNRAIVSVFVLLAGCNPESADLGPDAGARLDQTVQLVQTLPVGQGVSPCTGYRPIGSATSYGANADQSLQFASGPWLVPVTVPVGTQVQGFGVALIDNGGAVPNTVRVELVSSTSGTLGSITSLGSGTEQAWTSAFGTSHVTTGGEMLWFRATPTRGDGSLASLNSTLESLSVWSGLAPTHISAHAFVGLGGTSVSYDQNATFSRSGLVAASLPLRNCAAIESVRVYIKDSTTPASQAAAVLASTSQSGMENDIAASQVSNGNGTSQTLTITGSFPVTTGMSYWIEVKNVIGTGTVSISGADVTCQ